METKDINTLITDYLWGNVTDDDIRQLKAQLQADTQLRARFDALLNGTTLAARYRQYAAVKPPRRHRSAALRRWVGAAAVVALLLTAGAAVWWRQYTRVVPPVISDTMQQAMQQSQQAGRLEAVVDTWNERQPAAPSVAARQLMAARRVTTHEDKEFWQRLDDGTYVHLNYNTRLIYPEQFTDKTRDVVLDGEAYFMVATDKRRPFVVHTRQGDVRAYGTEFNVHTRSTLDTGGDSIARPQAEGGAGAGLEVVLVKGSLGVLPAGSDREQKLNPGEQATFNAQLSTFDIERVNVETYVAWNEGKFSFQGWPLERVMAVLARWYGFEKAVFTPDALRQKQLDGAFSRYDAVENIMESIATVLDLSIAIEQGTVIIRQQP